MGSLPEMNVDVEDCLSDSAAMTCGSPADGVERRAEARLGSASRAGLRRGFGFAAALAVEAGAQGLPQGVQAFAAAGDFQ